MLILISESFVSLSLVEAYETSIAVENSLPFLFAPISEIRVFSLALRCLNLVTRYRVFHPYEVGDILFFVYINAFLCGGKIKNIDH